MRRLVLILLLLFPAGYSYAVSTHLSPILQYPSIGSLDYLGQSSSRIFFPGQFSLGIVQRYSFKPLNLNDATGTQEVNVLKHNLWQLLQFGVGINKYWQFGFDFPWGTALQFDDPATAATTRSHESAIGDLRLMSRFRIRNPDEHRVGFGLEPFLTLPTGAEDRYFGEDSVSGGLALLLDWQPIPYWQFGFQTGAEIRPKISFRNADYGSRSQFGFSGQFRPKESFSLHLELQGSTPWNHFFRKELTPLELQAGFRWDIPPSGLNWRLGAGSCLVCGVRGSRFFAWSGLEYRFLNKKYYLAEREATLSRSLLLGEEYALTTLQGKCPKDPKNFDPKKHDPGCSKIFELRETAKLLNRCPANPEDFDPEKHDEECSKIYSLSGEYTQKEREQIYILAVQELSAECPQNEEEFDPENHDSSCPKVYELRGVSNLMAQCPDPEFFDPEIHDPNCNKVFVLAESYEDQQWAVIRARAEEDFDGDGIPDYLDACPNDPEDFDQFLDQDGCPEEEEDLRGIEELVSKGIVFFEFNRTNISNDGRDILVKIADMIFHHPELVQTLIIEGHSDEIGTKRAKQIISDRRTKAVVKYLRYRGVPDKVQLIAEPKSDTEPIDSNKTTEGRAKNRRVVIKFVH